MDLHIYHHDAGTSGDVLAAIKLLADQLTALTVLLKALSAQTAKGFAMTDRTLQEIADDVAQETTISQGLTTMVQALVAKASAVPGLTPEQQAQINAIGDGMTANIATFQAALAAGTAGLTGTPADSTVPPVTDTTGPT